MQARAAAGGLALWTSLAWCCRQPCWSWGRHAAGRCPPCSHRLLLALMLAFPGCPWHPAVCPLRSWLVTSTPNLSCTCSPARVFPPPQLADEGTLDLSHVRHFIVDECDKCLESIDMRTDVQVKSGTSAARCRLRAGHCAWLPSGGSGRSSPAAQHTRSRTLRFLCVWGGGGRTSAGAAVSRVGQPTNSPISVY